MDLPQSSKQTDGDLQPAKSADAPLSLSDIKQARNERKRGRAIRSGRILTPGLLSERMARSQATASTAGDSGGQRSGLSVDVDGEQLNHIPPTVHHLLEAATRLNLANNCFVEVPGLNVLSNLQSLSLAHNCISQVNGLKSLSSLTELDLSSNMITALVAGELPPCLARLQVGDNPVDPFQPEVLATLLKTLPQLARINDRPVVRPKDLTSQLSDESSVDSTTELVEDAIIELHTEEKQANLPAILGGILQPQRSPSKTYLDNLPSGKSPDEPLSPVRITISRQSSADMTNAAPTPEAMEVLARVRGALPRLREASDVSFDKQPSDNLDIIFAASRSLSAMQQTEAAFRCLHSAAFNSKGRAISVPLMDPKLLRPGLRSDDSATPKTADSSFPRSSPPPSYEEKPADFQKLLTTAIAMLVGSGGPPREAAVILDEEGVDVWAQSSLQRQQVLDSLFAKRLHRDRRDASQKERQQQRDKDGDGEITSAKQMEYKAKVRASLRRADSTISRHRRGGGEKGSTVNEEMLKGLGSKDAPRVEVLSEALQGPPIEPVRDQLAALSQTSSERATAENVRMVLRAGFQKMLSNMQKLRENDPAAAAATAVELRKLAKMKSMQKLLATKGAHLPPQPQVLASIVGSHSRLGSITERLAKALPTFSRPEAGQGGLADSDRTKSVHAYPRNAPGQPELASPFEAEPSAAKAPEPGPLGPPNLDRSSASASSSSEERHDPRAGGLLRQTTQKMLRRPGATEGGKPPPQKTPSQRRMQRPQQPPSPGSDTEPEPPVNRQAARPIFGGIAKMVRNPSGQVETPPSIFPARAASGRLPSGKPQKPLPAKAASQASLSSGVPSSQSNSASDTEKPPQAGLEAAPLHQSSMSADKSSRQSQDHSLASSKADESEKLPSHFNPELWNRFSGRGQAAARQLKPHSDGERPKKSAFFSPFSAANSVAGSPFSSSTAGPSAQQKESKPGETMGKSRPLDPAASPVLKTQGGEEEAENVPTSPAAVIGSAPSFSSNLQDRARQGSNPQRHPFDSSGSHMQPLHEEAATAAGPQEQERQGVQDFDPQRLQQMTSEYQAISLEEQQEKEP